MAEKKDPTREQAILIASKGLFPALYEEAAEIQNVLLNQIRDSGFAEDAAFMLADMVSKTDGFKNKSIEHLMITDSHGNPLSAEEIQLLNLGKSFELTDDIKLTVELIRKGEQLHYKKGTQIAVGVEAEFEVELEDDEKIKIQLNATFIQEVELSPKIKGYVIPYLVGIIPLPVGGKVNGTVDIKSFTAFSFEATIYTVAPEDESLWDQFKDTLKNPDKLADIEGLPEGLASGLKTAGDVLGKIRELQDDLSKMKDTAEDALGTAEEYAANIELLWSTIDHVITEQEYSAICEAFDQTNVTSDLLDMLELTDETGLNTEYYESMEALMERYCEMIEQETDWVTLLDKDILDQDVCVYGVAIGVDIDFVVRADLSLAIGSNMQYEVGKRYEFWFKFAPLYKKAGSIILDNVNFSTLSAPTNSWNDYANTNWYYEQGVAYCITSPSELAGLAKLVNQGVDFNGKIVWLSGDLDLRGHTWVPIGTSKKPFKGTFEGYGHTITGLYLDDSSKTGVGLFGYVTGSSDSLAVVRNVAVDDSWFYGKDRVGAVVGQAKYALIDNCVNYTNVKAHQLGLTSSYQSCAGGIVGEALYSKIVNCVNYGSVYAQGRLVGGIVGLVDKDGIVINNVNFGSVTGASRVGGVIGCMDGGNTLCWNNYNAGTVRPRDGSNDYIGAIVGRNVDDKGVAQFMYYLKDSAKGGNGKGRYAMGNDGGSVTDGNKNYDASSFETLDSILLSSAAIYGEGNTLIDALNACVEGESEPWDYNEIAPALWEATGPDGYPLPVGSPISKLR